MLRASLDWAASAIEAKARTPYSCARRPAVSADDIINPDKLDLARGGHLRVKPHMLLAERAGPEDGHSYLVAVP